jgi:6-pyruvoyltetrahydropterin/6-carboxytetrahydropterin synthase
MPELCRSVRFCLSRVNPGEVFAAAAAPKFSVHNGFAGWPSMADLGSFYELEVRCRGDVSPSTGYLINIKEIDEAVRKHALPIFDQAYRCPGSRSAPEVLRCVLLALKGPLNGLVTSIRWKLTPYYSLTMHQRSTERVIVRQQFEFAASHRLHCAQLTAAENQALFGKCNRASGHGHNYRLEPAVSLECRPVPSLNDFNLQRLEGIVDQTIIRRFDHTNLNVDVPEFAALNPSVENIARVCFDLLVAPIAAAGAVLETVTIWETDKTSCTYPG